MTDYTKCQKHNLHKTWINNTKKAYLYERLSGDKVRCHLCPRQCIIPVNSVGFCKVRKNLSGELYALSYEKAVQITTEFIETEAIFHYRPGANILSLGNFGCNLNCMYCQNWNVSQFQFTSPDWIHTYSSNEVIQRAKKDNIEILSWTYNDPVVWYEYVVDTAKKAREAGLKNLFKSAMYIGQDALTELTKHIDIFAVSIKAIDEDYYTSFTKGDLLPVLSACEYLVKNHPEIHVEISNLVVTDLTNNLESYDKMIDFVLEKLGPEIPIHFTRFHPAYKYNHVPRTPVEDVALARERALERGIKYAYVGNVFDHEGLNTYCPNCKNMLIKRYGLKSTIVDMTGNICNKCGSNILLKH